MRASSLVLWYIKVFDARVCDGDDVDDIDDIHLASKTTWLTLIFHIQDISPTRASI